MEELLRKNIDMICDEKESMLIVGKQVRNAQHGISDLNAVDNKGNLVLVEIKRESFKKWHTEKRIHTTGPYEN
jgi:RecB family endonuclease NucS